MVREDFPRRVRRTLVLGLGEDGWEAVRLLAERLETRHGGLPCVACLGILAGGDSFDETKAVTPQGGAPSGPIEAITEALAGISRIGHGWALRAKGFLLDCPDEVALAVVADLNAPHAGEMVLDLAYLARHLIRSRLNSHALSVGVLLLPDILAAGEPEEVRARASSSLEALDAFMGPHDGFQRRYGGGLRIEEWGPPFNTCYLTGPLNADGLALPSSGERANLVGEFLYRLLFSPLGQALRGLEPIAATFGSHRGFYGAFGLASWVYPAREMAEAAARRLAARMAGHILSPSSDEDSGAYGFLASREFVPQALEEALLPPMVLAEAGWDRGLEAPLSRPGIAAWREEVDEEVSRRQEELARRRSRLEGEAAKVAASLAKDVEEEVGRRLDDPKPGGIGRTRRFLQGVQEALEDFAVREKEEADRAFEALKAVEERIEGMAEQLDALTEGFPRNTRELLALALHPGRWLALWRRWRALTRARSLYLALLERRLQQVATIMRRDLTVRACREAIPLVEELGQKLDSLAEVLEGVAASPEEGEDALYGPLSFELERSILTPELVEALHAEVEGDLRREVEGYLEGSPLFRGLKGRVEARRIVEGLLSYARRRCQALVKVDMARLVGARWSVGDLEEELERLSGEAKPFLAWDETAMDEAESGGIEEALLLEADGLPPSLRRRLEAPERGWRIVNGGDPHRWTVLRMIRGLPLEAILSHNI